MFTTSKPTVTVFAFVTPDDRTEWSIRVTLEAKMKGASDLDRAEARARKIEALPELIQALSDMLDRFTEWTTD